MKPLFFLITTFYLLSLLSSSAAPAPTNSSNVLYEVSGLIRVYRNRKIVRLSGTETVPPSYDSKTRVLSKDILIHTPTPNLSIKARLFLPHNDVVAAPCNCTRKLPLLVYFHGGGFLTASPFTPNYHNHVNSLSGKANAVALSVDYRLAPENPLPIAYQDSLLALKWVFSHSSGAGVDSCLNGCVDFRRVYLGGDSAGANIAHNVAMRVGSGLGEGIQLRGMFLNCPHFWGKQRIGREDEQPESAAWVESIWTHAYPNSTGFDDPASNPAMDPNLAKLGCRKVVVYVAEQDVLRDRGYYYEEALKRSKWGGKIRVVEVKGENHVFNIVNPNSTKAQKMLKELAGFLS